MARNPASKPNPATIADEQARAFRLKLDGLSVREIANHMGMARSTVQDRLDAAYDELVHPLAEEVRQLELARLDRWQKRLEDRLEDGEAPERIIPIGLKVLDRRAKYLGLDAPLRVDANVTETTQEDLAIQDLLSAAHAANAEHARRLEQ